MKKILFPSVILAVLVAFCVYATWRVDRLCSYSAELLEKAGARCEQMDFDGAGDLVYEAKRSWDHHEGILGIALRHTESDDISVMFSPLLETCRQKDAEEFQRRNLELIQGLRQISRMEIPYYFNIL